MTHVLQQENGSPEAHPEHGNTGLATDTLTPGRASDTARRRTSCQGHSQCLLSHDIRGGEPLGGARQSLGANTTHARKLT